MFIPDISAKQPKLATADENSKDSHTRATDLGYHFSKRKILLLDYDKDCITFMNSNDSQLFARMLRRISNSPQISYISRAQPLLRLLIDAAQELLLTPIEIAVFDIYLSRFGWNDTSLPLDYLLFYVGLAAKRYLGGRIHHIAEHLNYKTRNFSDNFSRWDIGTYKELNIDMHQLNQAYNRLTEKSQEKCINYNYYVDEILQIALPYLTDSKERNEKLNRDSKIENEESSEETHTHATRISERSTRQGREADNGSTVPLSHRVLYDKIDTICTEFLMSNQIQQTLSASGNVAGLNIRN